MPMPSAPPPRSLTVWLVGRAIAATLAVGLAGVGLTAVLLPDPGGDGASWWPTAAAALCGAGLLAGAVALLLQRTVARPLAVLEAAIRDVDPDLDGNVGPADRALISAADLEIDGSLADTEIDRLTRTVLDHVNGLVRSHAHLSVMVRKDPLTGLPNRICIGEAMDAAVQRARDTDLQVALLYLDLDRFKHINDSLGHAAGDKLLQLVAARLREVCPSPNAIARMGGDEFMILMERLDDRAQAIRLAEDVLAALSHPFQISGHAVHVGTSIGISIWPRDGSDSEQLMRSADTAMYAAKAAGAGTWRFFSREMRERSLVWLRTEASLREALEQEELEVFYQPKVIAGSGRLYGMEALLRWRRADRHVSPNEFIGIAEDTGLIIPIGAWVLRTACAQAVRWGRMHGPLQLAVNVSARQLRTQEFADTVRTALEETGLPAARLTLEITESMLMDDVDAALEALRGLRSIGVGIAVDDFGTGYSSLAYLRQLPITQLKIDRSFIRDVPGDTAISEMVMTLATKLNLQCVAEGVETAQQFEWLAASGCDLVQGYYISMPLPARAFEQEFLRESRLRLVVNADDPASVRTGI